MPYSLTPLYCGEKNTWLSKSIPLIQQQDMMISLRGPAIHRHRQKTRTMNPRIINNPNLLKYIIKDLG